MTWRSWHGICVEHQHADSATLICHFCSSVCPSIDCSTNCQTFHHLVGDITVVFLSPAVLTKCQGITPQGDVKYAGVGKFAIFNRNHLFCRTQYEICSLSANNQHRQFQIVTKDTPVRNATGHVRIGGVCVMRSTNILLLLLLGLLLLLLLLLLHRNHRQRIDPFQFRWPRVTLISVRTLVLFDLERPNYRQRYTSRYRACF